MNINVDIQIAVGYERGEVMLPKYATEGSSCFDLHSTIDIEILPGNVYKIPTGICIQVPHGLEMQIRSRSGLASKGLVVSNGVGVLDSDYTGEIFVLMHSLYEPYTIKKFDRIAQACICPTYTANFNLVTMLKPTKRGSGGFGSTDKN